jgi:hypothetical protein
MWPLSFLTAFLSVVQPFLEKHPSLLLHESAVRGHTDICFSQIIEGARGRRGMGLKQRDDA